MEKITNAPDHIVRAALIALCNDSTIRHKAVEYIDKMSSGVAGGRKRKAESAVKICVKCQDPFREEDNGPKACRFHDGYLGIDYDHDTWADWDEPCHGLMDTQENREEYPEGFVWDCCEKRGTSRGCKRGPHESANASRGRYGGGGDDAGDESGRDNRPEEEEDEESGEDEDEDEEEYD
ncbi:hypothetical protein F4775DRAFT_534852, partial [Biscogniauxia sp. FL1348]